MERKCYRLRDKRMICGVCAGVADYFHIDVLLVRIVWVALGFCYFVGLVAYLLAAVFLPEK